VSVFTPSHRPAFLDECLSSLLGQSFEDWEWLVLLNQGTRWRPEKDDPRVRLVVDDSVRGVGAAKRAACAAARGDILVELDHDDLLASDALLELVQAFDAHPEIGFVYSNCAQIRVDGSKDPEMFDLNYGWSYEDVEVDGRSVLMVNSLDSSPHNVSYIWYAPNHVRSFRRSTYELAGGYDASREIVEAQDLMCRLYQHTDFHLVPKCLYLQRIHDTNTQRNSELNARIQNETVELYETYVHANAMAWARRRGLLALDLGAAYNKPPGFLGVDQQDAPGVDIVGDVSEGIDLPDSSVGVIRAFDFLEHVPDKIGLFNELYRLLAHGGLLLSMTPSTDGRGAFQDPTHVAYYNENAFWYFTDKSLSQFVPEIRCRFQVSRLVTYFPSEWHEQHNISYVEANLIALKDGPRQGGLVAI
jgi:glycosyltransferase involved in cell wall biosynthesis